MTFELTESDYELLLEAVKCWESKDSNSAVMGEMLGVMFGRGKDKSDDEYKREMEQRMSKAEKAGQMKAERGVILRAKLIQLRNSLAADKILETAANPVE